MYDILQESLRIGHYTCCDVKNVILFMIMYFVDIKQIREQYV
jgi:hypothetical protein